MSSFLGSMRQSMLAPNLTAITFAERGIPGVAA